MSDISSARVGMPFAIDWPVGTQSGAELWALQLTMRLQQGPHRMISVVPPSQGLSGFSSQAISAVRAAISASAGPLEALQSLPADGLLPLMLIRTLGDALHGLPEIFSQCALARIGVMTGTATGFDASARDRGRAHDVLVARSTWMRGVLAANGFDGVKLLNTGVDVTVFQPKSLHSHNVPGRFVIFSAGRLCYRKGQDLVLAAVKAFRTRHPDAVLMTAWQSPFPEHSRDLRRGGLVTNLPSYVGGELQVAEWAQREGLAGNAIVELGRQSQAELSTMLEEADVAIFPNRAESDANPHVLECMAKGVPVILSHNTGHLDVAHAAHSWPLLRQDAVVHTSLSNTRGVVASVGTDGWGESSVDEIVEHLEQIYINREAARVRAARARAFVTPMDWGTQVQRLMALLAPFAARARAA